MHAIRRTLLAVLGCAFDLAVFRLLAPEAGLAHLALAAVVLAVFDHLAVTRWRTPSLLVSGCLLASLALWVAARIAGSAGAAAAPLPVLACAVLPWPGHLLARIAGRVLPRRPVALQGPPRSRRAARLALLRTPGAAWRLAAPADPAPVVLAVVSAQDTVRLGRETLPLEPQGPTEGMGRIVKRSMDLALGIPLLILTTPLTAALAIAARATSPGPGFHVQDRVSIGGRIFRLHKIRSMIAEAEPEGVAVWPQEHDPRITRLGRFLRRYWLDELPQFWDVIVGHLSLVGPRPERPSFVQAFSRELPKYPQRHQVKAGITGLAQVEGFTGNTSIARRLELDLRYIRAWSPCLDIKLLFGTVHRAVRRPPILAARRGAPARTGEEAESSPPKPHSTSTCAKSTPSAY